jgi:hypothetical protein
VCLQTKEYVLGKKAIELALSMHDNSIDKNNLMIVENALHDLEPKFDSVHN